MYLSFLLRSIVEQKPQPQEPELFASAEQVPELECIPDPVPEEC
jgi:hypothetical protein